MKNVAWFFSLRNETKMEVKLSGVLIKNWSNIK